LTVLQTICPISEALVSGAVELRGDQATSIELDFWASKSRWRAVPGEARSAIHRPILPWALPLSGFWTLSRRFAVATVCLIDHRVIAFASPVRPWVWFQLRSAVSKQCHSGRWSGGPFNVSSDRCLAASLEVGRDLDCCFGPGRGTRASCVRFCTVRADERDQRDQRLSARRGAQPI
jgi:hypothetical protein